MWHTQNFRETTEPCWTGIPQKLSPGAPGRASFKWPLPRTQERPLAQLSAWLQGPCCAPDYVLGARDSEKLGNIPYLELPAQWERRHLNRSLKDVARTLNELGMHRRIWALNRLGRKSQGWLPGGGDSSKR